MSTGSGTERAEAIETVGVIAPPAHGSWRSLGERRLRPGFHPVWLLIAPTMLLVIGLLAVVFWISLMQGIPFTPNAIVTLGNYQSLYANPFVLTAFGNTIGYAGTAVAVALFFGLTIAWLVERTDLPGKLAIYVIMFLGVLVPGFFLAMGWLFLLDPRIGAINHMLIALFGPGAIRLEASSVFAMGWVSGLSSASIAFVLTAPAFVAMDPALDEAASIHGARFSQRMRRVFLPLMFPAILASTLYIFTSQVGSFDTPAFLGVPSRVYTFSTFVWAQRFAADESGVPAHGIVAAMSVFMIVVAVISSYYYARVISRANQYQVITGKGYRPKRIALGRWAIVAWAFIGLYVLFSKLLPFSLMAWAAGLPFFQPVSLEAMSNLSLANFRAISFEHLGTAARHTAILMIAAPAATLIVAFCFAYLVVRTKSRLRGLVDGFAFLPHAIPDIIFALGAIFITLFLLQGTGLYGSLAVIAIVYVVARISFATRLLNSSLIQVHHELEDAAAMAGARGLRVTRSILVPLVLPALLTGWLWMALATYKELTVATFLVSPGSITLPVVVWNAWYAGKLGLSAAIGIVLLLGLVPLALLYLVVGRRHIMGGGMR